MGLVEKWNGDFEALSKTNQLVLLSVSMFFFFGVHNILQEAIINVPGFEHGVMLGYFEVLAVTICSYCERTCIRKETGRTAPLGAYPLLTACLMTSSGLSNMALNYINFPTKVVFRSCKLVPTMIVATLMNKKVFSSAEYLCAFSVCMGLVMFTTADWQLTPSFNPIGLVLVTTSVFADSILPNAQERIFKSGASRLEVTMFTNFFTLIAMTISTLASGDLIGAVEHALRDDQLLFYIIVYTSISYVAISSYMAIVKRFGGVVAICLTTLRKVMTLVLSFMLFPKEFSWYYVGGAGLVLGGLFAAAMIKQKKRKEMEQQETKPLISGDLERGDDASVSSVQSSSSVRSSSSAHSSSTR